LAGGGGGGEEGGEGGGGGGEVGDAEGVRCESGADGTRGDESVESPCEARKVAKVMGNGGERGGVSIEVGDVGGGSGAEP